MTAREKEVLGEALRLTEKQRARLAAELLASISGKTDRGAERAWALEIERRANRARSGESTGTEWATVKARVVKARRRR